MLKLSDFVLNNNDKYFCDRCGKPTYKYSRYHVGTYAEQVESNYTKHFCEDCFVIAVKEWLQWCDYKRSKE